MTEFWEATQTWINKQGWPEDVEVEALLMVQRREGLGLNALTGSQWVAWAESKGLTTTLHTDQQKGPQ